MSITVAVTGHRPEQFTTEERAWVRLTLPPLVQDLVVHENMSYGLTGMARGVDTWWGLALLAAGIPYGAYIPECEHRLGWSEQDQSLWSLLHDNAHATRTITAGGYPRDYHARNDALIADSNILIGVHVTNPTSNGTWSTMQKALDRGRLLLDVNATTRTIEWAQGKER